MTPYRKAPPEDRKHVPPLWRRALRWTRKEAVIFNHVTMMLLALGIVIAFSPLLLPLGILGYFFKKLG